MKLRPPRSEQQVEEQVEVGDVIVSVMKVHDMHVCLYIYESLSLIG
jgi:hypothetical protein